MEPATDDPAQSERPSVDCVHRHRRRHAQRAACERKQREAARLHTCVPRYRQKKGLRVEANVRESESAKICITDTPSPSSTATRVITSAVR